MTSTERPEEKARRLAKQGEFFFAKWVADVGKERQAPVLVMGTDADPEDVVVCGCTSKPARTPFDIEVTLRQPTFVRTNKIYTIGRSQLEFPLPQKPTADQLAQIKDNLKKLLDITSPTPATTTTLATLTTASPTPTAKTP